MVYANPDNGACPADHPVSLPQITYEIDYPGITGGSQYTLSSHGAYSMHADFFAAWDPQVQNALVTGCLNAGLNCIDVNREGGQLVAGDNNPVTLTLANFPATNTQVLSAPTTPAATKSARTKSAPTKSVPAPKAATTHARPATPAPTRTPATTRARPSTPAPTPILLDAGTMGLAGGAFGLALLIIAAYQLRRRLRDHHDRRQDWG
jgi:hypothetical protein